MIKYLVMDVDGTLTDGKIYMGDDREIFKAFNIKDGYAITHMIKNAGIEPVIITGRTSAIVKKRCKELGIKKFFQGKIEKMEVLRTVLGQEGLDVCAYIGDDIPDFECMEQVKRAGGKIGCPSDAINSIKNICDFISPNKGGDGAVRDFVEWLLESEM